MHATTQTRRTSAYTLRFSTPEQVQQADDALTVALTDRGTLSLTWRSSGDVAALITAEDALREAGLATTPGIILTTGLGVHRRTVATTD